jgi:PAS domain S-box-containing protein
MNSNGENSNLKPNNHLNSHIIGNKICLAVFFSFVLLCILVWINEVFDIPHLVFGAPRSLINWRESLSETVLIAFIGFLVMLIIIKGIRKCKKDEEMILESREKYRTLVETIGDIVFTLDLDGRFTYLNSECEKVAQYSTHELMGRPFTDVLAPEYIESTINNFQGGLSGKEIPVYEIELLDKSGRKIPVELKVTSLLDPNGKIIGRIGVARNISEKKKLETQLQNIQKMEAIGTLAGGIAHDFNNLLTGILGNISLMLSGMNSDNPIYEILKNLEQYVQNGANLTKQLLSFAIGGKYEIQQTDANDLVKKTVGIFSRSKKEIAIYEKYAEDLCFVEVDQGQIGQVLLNLYVNALQAMPEGGELYIKTENITLDEDYVRPFNLKSGRYIKISVTDTGVGMDESIRQRIFEPFFTTKKKGRGTGLGLASAYRIIKTHKGIINVYSEKGKGTTFYIYLPISKKETDKESLTVDNEKILVGDETILLVDDDDMIIYVGVKMLEKIGYKVMKARTGKEAIEIYRENQKKIDLVILDMIMPEMGGGEVYDFLKSINPKIKVLLSSGYSLKGEAKGILERGCNGFIQKPINMKNLSLKIRKILDT